MTDSNGVNFNYPQICKELLNDLPQRQKEIILRRFGLKTGQKETLESIGQDYGITRERVRQIEEDGILRLKPKLGKYQKIFQYFIAQLKATGDLRKEDILLEQLGNKKWKNQVYFLLTLEEHFERFGETDDFYSLWTINRSSLNLAKKVIDSFYNQLTQMNRPLSLKEVTLPPPALHLRPSPKRAVVSSYLEISKKIQKNSEGFYGLRDWPEINPRGVKDKAYLVFKKVKKPLHFSEVANLIEGALIQTVHNELIRDPRFVLIGRGIYALKEWGYEPGEVKEVILRILKEAGKPLTKEEILEKVREQRLVKENTILLNLSNKKYFLRNSQGKYFVKEA